MKLKIIVPLIISILIIGIYTIFTSVKAIDLDSANIVSGGDCGSLLKYKGVVVKAYYAHYTKDGTNYPAYCLDKTKKRCR